VNSNIRPIEVYSLLKRTGDDFGIFDCASSRSNIIASITATELLFSNEDNDDCVGNSAR